MNGAYAQPTRLKVAFPTAFQALFRPFRYKCFYGGRGKAVSWSYARALLLKALKHPLRILCTRELQNSIKDSVHQLLVRQIELLGLSDRFDVTQPEIRSDIGAVFIFKGLRYNIEEVKSMEGVDVAWVAEAQNMSEQSWKILPPTIRNPGSEIWVDFNTNFETDPTYQRMVVHTPPNSYVRKVSWRDNPWFPKELREEMEYDRRVDPESAAHVWDGGFAVFNNAAVLAGKWRVDTFDTPVDADGPYFGGDWGFSQDPTVLIRCWIKDRKLLIDYEAYKIGCELDDTPALFDTVPLVRNYTIRADSARPETISHIKKKGFKIEPAVKYKGSIEDGIGFLRSFEEIIIHERCRHTIQEARLYSHKKDRLTGDPLPDIVDKHNNTWDATRYALEKMIMLSRQSGRPSIRAL